MHVAVLPLSSRLQETDHSEIKLKTFHIGPTTHVIPEAPLAGVLWHPLAAASPSTDCLVTVTTDAAVRLWEIERTNTWSFERPALAIDLRKLADGTSSDQDFEPSGFGRTRGFSADNFDMEAAAVCFGGVGAESEDPWACMTLWTSMTNGDVYALCPLLPSKWTPSPTTVPSLTTSAVTRLASMPSETESDEQNAARQRYEWVQELDDETLEFSDTTREPVRLRPSNPSAIPRLQGPFELPIELEDDVEACDIIVLPANFDEEDLFSGEDDYEIIGGARSLPFTVICLSTTDNKTHVLIELDGVTGQWLPKKGRTSFSVPTSDAGEFVLLETITLPGSSTDASTRPTFTLDPSNPYEFYVTTSKSVTSVSLEDWAARIGSEVSGETDTDSGLQSRLALACQSTICVTQTPITQEAASLSTAVLIDNIDIGTLLLTSSESRAIATQLDQSSFRTSKILTSEPAFTSSTRGHTRNQSTFRASQSLMQVLSADNQPQVDTPPTREPYAPPRVFYENHMAPIDRLRSSIPVQHRHVLTQSPMQMSPVCLTIMTTAHRTLSGQTSDIERAVAELFRRCERLREELSDQVAQMAQLAERLQQIGSGNESDELVKDTQNPIPHDEQISARITAAQTRQKELFARYERVRKRAAQIRSGNKPINVSEQRWIDEVSNLSKHVGVEDTDSSNDENLMSRFDAAQKLSGELVAETKRAKEASETEGGDNGTPDGKLRARLNPSGMSRIQRERVKDVMEMVEREGMVIEAVRGRLANLGVQA